MQKSSSNKEFTTDNKKERISAALELCYGLHLDEAERELSTIIGQVPSDSDAYSALALIRLMQGMPGSQKDILMRSLDINPDHYATLHQLAIVHFREAELDKGFKTIQRALEQKPDSASSLLLASRLCLAQGNGKEAYRLSGIVHRQSNGYQQQAASLMALALILDNDAEPLNSQLVNSIIAGQGDEIKLYAAVYLIRSLQSEEIYIESCERRLRLDPDNRFLRLLRVKLLAAKGRHDDCFSDLYYLLSLEQDNVITLHSFAEALLAMKRYRESLEVYLRIIRVKGKDPQLLNQIGVCFRGMGRLRSSEKAYWRSIRLNPLDACIIGNLGESSFRLGNFKRAIELYDIALNINPLYKEVFYNKMLCFSVQDPSSMGEIRIEAAKFWSAYRSAYSIDEPSHRIAAKGGSQIAEPSSQRPPKAKRRIGILSSDIGNHCVSYFLTSFLRHYNKNEFHIELILYDRRYEKREAEICGYVDYALSLQGLSEHEARDAIKDRRLDLIIECNGYTGGSGISLLAERCAPIQCHYIGYHASTGLDTIDYFISDSHILSPSVSAELSEKPLRLDRAWLAFSTFEDFPIATSTAKVERPVLGFFGNSTKITDRTLEFWSALFLNCPNAILALKCLSYRDPFIVQRVLARIESAGIDRSKVAIFEPTASWKDHLEYYNLVDYALDSTFWSSATTGFDALGMGVPLLAIQGNTIAARMSSSLVSHLGRKEWIASTPSDYAMLGERICSEFMEVRQQKNDLQAEILSSSLFDGPGLARSLEKALQQVLNHNSVANMLGEL